MRRATVPLGGQTAEGHGVNVHEIHAGAVYKDSNVRVTAFPTKHAMESFAYRFDTPDRSIVISGDTNPTQAIIDACHGCDILIHEVRSLAGLAKRPPAFQRFASRYHTTTVQLAELASQAKPRLLILYHHAIAVVGRDLDVF
jgi:ribonuclease BN (tRNA processing enzyme)